MTTANGKRFRLVTEQGAERHVSAVVLGADEVAESLEAEAYLHEAAGWTVTRGSSFVAARKGKITRAISVLAFSPMEDLGGKR